MKYRLTWSFIIINVIVFEIIFSMPEQLMNSAFALLDFSPGKSLELWRWFTSLFLHASASHLFFNMLALYFFGRVLEDEVRPGQWLAIYFASGLFGNLIYGLTSAEPAVGASGCIFGIMAAAMLIEPVKMIRIYIMPLPLGMIAILYIISQVALAASPVGSEEIAYMAHVGGLVAGSALMFYLKPKNVVRCSLVLLGLLVLLLVLYPVILLLIGIAEIILGMIDFVVGIFLYGIAHFLLSWIW